MGKEKRDSEKEGKQKEQKKKAKKEKDKEKKKASNAKSAERSPAESAKLKNEALKQYIATMKRIDARSALVHGITGNFQGRIYANGKDRSAKTHSPKRLRRRRRRDVDPMAREIRQLKAILRRQQLRLSAQKTRFEREINGENVAPQSLKRVQKKRNRKKRGPILFRRDGAFTVRRNVKLGRVAVRDEMRFEFGVRFGESMRDEWASILRCGDDDLQRLPNVMARRGHRLQISWSTRRNNDFAVRVGPEMKEGGAYRVDVHVTQRRLSVRINGHLCYDGAKGPHRTRPAVMCWAGDPWFTAADAHIARLAITTGPHIRDIETTHKHMRKKKRHKRRRRRRKKKRALALYRPFGGALRGAMKNAFERRTASLTMPPPLGFAQFVRLRHAMNPLRLPQITGLRGHYALRR